MAQCADPILGLVDCDEIIIPGWGPGTPPPSPTPGGSYDPGKAGKPGDALWGIPSPCGPKDSECQFRFWLRAFAYTDCAKNSGRGGSNCNDTDTKKVICDLERSSPFTSDYCGTRKTSPGSPGPAVTATGRYRTPGGVRGGTQGTRPGDIPFTYADQAFVAPLPVAALATDIGGGAAFSGAAPGILDALAYIGTWLAGFILPLFIPGQLSDDIPYTGPNPFPLQPSRKPTVADRPDTILPDLIGVPLPEPGIEEIIVVAPSIRPTPYPLQQPFAAPFVVLSPGSPFGVPAPGDPFSTPKNRPTTSPERRPSSRPTGVPRSPIGAPTFMPFVGDPLISAPLRAPATPKGKAKPLAPPLTLFDPYTLPSPQPFKPGVPVEVSTCPPCDKKKDKKKEPRKPRGTCYRGTYTETSFGLKKSRGVQIPCQ